MDTSLTLEVVLNSIMTFSFILVFAILGAVCKDYYSIVTRKYRKVKIGRILVTAITGAIAMYGLSGLKIFNGSPRLITMFSYISGLVGFELLGKLSNLKGVKEFIDYLWKYKSRE